MDLPESAPRTRWTPAAIPLGLLVLLLGAWEFVVPLVGPYFGFGFFTSSAWVFSSVHWELLLGPGIALACGGLLMLRPAGAPSSLGGLLALLAGAWLVVGPSLHPIWSGPVAVATQHAQWLTSLLWIGYFYGSGAVAVYLSGALHGLLGRRPVVYRERPAIEDAPLEQERTFSHT
jgi:hypothetical protein